MEKYIVFYSLFLVIITYVWSSTVFKQYSASKNQFFKYKHPRFGENKIRYLFTPGKKLLNDNLLCIHGFGGNSDQWRRNTPVLSENGFNSYAIDLLGYGYSEKPSPKLYGVNEIYNFDTWTNQTIQFIEEVVRKPVFLVSNSVGGIAALKTAVERPDLVKGVVLIDISLRMLHVSKQAPIMRPFVSLLQKVLRETNIGKSFFKQVAQPNALKNILSQAYAERVDDEVVDIILKPGLEPGAAEVFLDFISYR